ncbi:MAG: EAL domain-containing protein [Cyanobacteria bacterium P01_G01_bin.54]
MAEVALIQKNAKQVWTDTEHAQAKAALAANLRDTERLRKLSARLVAEDDIQTLYEDILDTTIALMRADGGAIQFFDTATEELVFLVARGFHHSLTDGFSRVDVNSRTVCGRALAAKKQVRVNYAVAFREESHDAWRLVLEAGYRSGQATPLIARSGQLIGMISTYWHEEHRSGDRELQFLDLLTRQAADLIAQWQDRNALRKSEAKYSSLFNSIDEGFCICKILLDKQGVPLDYRFLDVNPVFESLTGLYYPVGKTARELMPDIEDFWIKTYGQVALTRESIRFENYAELMQRWLDIYAFPFGEPQDHLVGILLTNITERKSIEGEREHFLAIGSDLRTIANPNGYFQWVSPTFEQLLGWTAEELTSQPWIEFVHPDDVSPTTQEANRLFAGGRTLAFENRYRHKDGSYRWLRWKSQLDLVQQVIYATAIDITRSKQAEASLQRYNEELEIQVVKRTADLVKSLSDLEASKEQLHHQAHHDSLTGLPNRLLFHVRLEQGLQQATQDQTQLAVVFIDLDRFKQINDSLGHRLGDELLQQVAHRLHQAIRANDTIARISGDEFVVLLTDIQAHQQVVNALHRLMDCFECPFTLGKQMIYATASLGVCLFPNDGTDADVLLRNADTAMYNAKEERNTYCFYNEAMTLAAIQQVSLENALRIALKQEELSLVYQPQINMRSQALIGLEVFLRWQHPEFGPISPAQFIPIAEQSGLIQAIGAWVLRTVCLQGRVWFEQGLNFGRIAVNVAASQIKDKNFIHVVQSALEVSGLPPNCLELEVTESLVMEYAEEKIQLLNQLRQLGVQLSIDDFGTGYSSLSYLKRLPIDKLKIDQSFVRDIPKDPNDMAIAEAIIALGKALNIQIIAEGVENEKQANFLKMKGCYEAQGYLYSHPLFLEEVEQKLRCISQNRNPLTSIV